MQSYFEKGDVLDLTAPAGGVTVDVPVKIGSLVGIPVDTAAAGVTVPVRIKGVFDGVPKDTVGAWTEGETIYWDDTNKVFTTTATSNTKCGVAVKAALQADTTGRIKLVVSL